MSAMRMFQELCSVPTWERSLFGGIRANEGGLLLFRSTRSLEIAKKVATVIRVARDCEYQRRKSRPYDRRLDWNRRLLIAPLFQDAEGGIALECAVGSLHFDSPRRHSGRDCRRDFGTRYNCKACSGPVEGDGGCAG